MHCDGIRKSQTQSAHHHEWTTTINIRQYTNQINRQECEESIHTTDWRETEKERSCEIESGKVKEKVYMRVDEGEKKRDRVR